MAESSLASSAEKIEKFLTSSLDATLDTYHDKVITKLEDIIKIISKGGAAAASGDKKDKKDDKKDKKDASEAVSSMAKGIDAIAKAVKEFGKHEKDGDKFIKFLEKFASKEHLEQWGSEKFTKAMANICRIGDSIGSIAKNLALSTPLLLIGIPGALMLIPVMALLNIAFGLLSVSTLPVLIGAFALKVMGKAMVKFATAMFMTALAILINPWSLLMPVIFTGIIMLFFGLAKFAKIEDMIKLTSAVSSIGLAMLAMSASVLLAGLITWPMVVKFLGVIAAFYIVCKLFGSDKMAKKSIITGTTMLAIAGSVAILAIAMLILNKVEWESVGKGLAVMLGLAAVVFVMGLMKNQVMSGAAVLVAIGASVFLISLACKRFQETSWETLGKVGAVILGLTAVIIALSYAGVIILPGAAVLLAIGGCILAFAVALKIMSAIPLDANNIELIGDSMLSIAKTIAILGLPLFNITVILGAAVGLILAGSLIAIGKGLSLFAQNQVNKENCDAICETILSISWTIAKLGMPIYNTLVIYGSAVALFLSGAMIAIAKGLNAMANTSTGMSKEQVIKIGKLIYAFAALFAGLCLGWSIIGCGAAAAMGIGGALISIGKGLEKFGKLELDSLIGDDPKETKIYKVINSLIAPFAELGKQSTGESVLGRFVSHVFGIPDDASKGLECVSKMGDALVDIAKAIRMWANLTYIDEDGNESSLAMTDMTQMSENIKSMVISISGVIEEVGRNYCNDEDIGWFEKTNFQKGIECLDGNFKGISDMAKVVKDMAAFKFKDPETDKWIQITPDMLDENKEGSITYNIEKMIKGFCAVISNIGEDPNAEQRGPIGTFFMGETKFQKGINAINSMAGDLFKLADIAKSVADLFKQNLTADEISLQVQRILKGMTEAVNGAADDKGNAKWVFSTSKLNALKSVAEVLGKVAGYATNLNKVTTALGKIPDHLKKSVDVINGLQNDKLKAAKEFFDTLVEFEKKEVDIIEKKAEHVNSMLNKTQEEKSSRSDISDSKNKDGKATKEGKESSNMTEVVASLAEIVADMSTKLAAISNTLSSGVVNVKAKGSSNNTWWTTNN